MVQARRAAVAGMLALLLACGDREAARSPAACDVSVVPIESGFGSRGPYASRLETVANPLHPELVVSVYLPIGAAIPVPVVLFAHANEQGDPATYHALIEHLVGRGIAVVFSPYTIGSADHHERYATLWAGMQAAVDALAPHLDTTRMGFVGHSYGAGALPFVARQALQERRWGAEGAFLYSMAPWYALFMDDEALRELPEHLRVLIEVFEDDTATDHRIAIEQFAKIGVPADFKEFVRVRTDVHGACRQDAVHTVPQSTGLRARDDALDVYAVYRLLDALAAFAFEGDPEGRRIALGHGTADQIDMGTWTDGTPVTRLEVSRDPKPIRPETRYVFRWSDREAWRRYGGGDADGLKRGAATPEP